MTAYLRSAAAAIVLAGALAGCSVSSLLGGGKAPPVLFTLTSAAPPAAPVKSAAVGETVTIRTPVVPKELRTVRVPVEIAPTQVQYVKDLQWVDTPDKLFQDLVEEMEHRYRMTRETGADNLREHVEKTGKPLPRIVCVCDEYYALVSQQREEKQAIEQAIGLLGAKGRAAGVHLTLATQQPSRQTINGAIQANLPCRVALYLQSPIESNMIINQSGAERLTGMGDLLYKDFGNPVRLQGAYLRAKERAEIFR